MTLRRSIQVPGSTTNLGAGFDVLGLALQLYLRVDLQETSRPKAEFELLGEGAGDLPASEENLLWKVTRRVFEEKQPVPGVRLKIENNPSGSRSGKQCCALWQASLLRGLTGRNSRRTSSSSTPLSLRTTPTTSPPLDLAGSRMPWRKWKVSSLGLNCTKLKILLTFLSSVLKRRSPCGDSSNLDLRDAVFNLQRSSLTVAAP
jgi:homoserine kinase